MDEKALQHTQIRKMKKPIGVDFQKVKMILRWIFRCLYYIGQHIVLPLFHLHPGIYPIKFLEIF